MASTLFWIATQTLVNAIVYIKRSPFVSSADQPDQIKTYANKSYLYASRVFRPSTSTASRLPVVIRVHGGGFVMGNPAVDDPLARYIADNAHCIVVAIDYRKSPRNVFPAAYEDVIELIQTVINDPELNVDPAKVILSGTSAGGNLVLATAQDTRLQGKILGIMAITPAVDFVPSFEEKMASRPDASVPDFLQNTYNGILQRYCGTAPRDVKDVKLSPTYFARRDDLPVHIYINAAEHDMLAKEAEAMADKLAQDQAKRSEGRNWQAGTVKFSFIEGQKHAFEAFPEKDPDADAARQHAVKTMYGDVADWIRGVTAA